MTDTGPVSVQRVALHDIAAMRAAFRAEMNCQIVHDSIHHRPGWTVEFALNEGDRAVGYASVAVGGPWRDRPTFYELYVTPERRSRTYALFEAFTAAAHPLAFEVQSSDVLTTMMALTFARDIASERVVFRDASTTSLSVPGARLRCATPDADIQAAIAARQGGGDWHLEVDGVVVGKGGILFHYNPPYGDVFMDVEEGYRRRGLGSYLVQELKRVCYELGGIPAARCDSTNAASRRTLQKGGFLPYAHILVGSFPWTTESGDSPSGHGT